ncbi:MAG TPA: SOS response-associated peptidase [Polyangiaceae bacterium]|nr:SOS response-associated peptidase [Polyangiaceae bacterium]
MCGRFVQKCGLDALAKAFPGVLFPGELSGPPRYNVAPSQDVLALPNDGAMTARAMHWGLVPRWAKEPKGLINARSETAAEKPSFREALRRHRCLVFADGFYEWAEAPGKGGKVPWYFELEGGRPFAFAGIFDLWRDPEGAEHPGIALLTTKANKVVQPVHDRMPVIVPPAAFKAWLEPGEAAPADLEPLLRPLPSKSMRAWPVSRLVNDPKHNGPELIAPAPDAG